MMKKILSLLLCIVMVAALFVGCSGNGGGETGGTGAMWAGYAREDVTPNEKDSLPLAGLAARNSEGVLDPLYVTCIAIKDEAGVTFLLYHCDFLKVYNALNMAKRQISKETGVAVENIIVATTHNHSAPGLDDDSSAIIEDYAKIVRNGMVKAGKDAVADLKPAKMFVTEKKCEKMTYVRHYERKNGTVHGSGGSLNELYVGYAAPVDDTMELVKFVREGGKDIVLMNWQGHPRGHSTSDNSYEAEGIATRNMILSDVDVIRRNIEPALDCHFAYFLGTSGNSNNSSSIKEDRITENYVDHGTKLAELAVEASANFREVKGGGLKKVSTKVEAVYKNGGQTDQITISVLTIGNSIAFAIVPYEMFNSSGLELKEYTKDTFEQTLILTCTDNHFGYLPTMDTFDPGRYPTEAYEVGATNYIEGTAEDLVAGYKSLFDQLTK